MRKRVLFLSFTLIICLLLSSTIVQATGTWETGKTSGRVDKYGMTLQAFKGTQGTELCIGILPKIPEYGILNEIAKVQIKLFDENGKHIYTENYYNIPLDKGQGVINIDSLYQYNKIQVKASVDTITGMENETQWIDEAQILLKPDLVIEAVEYPQIVLVNTDFNIGVVVKEVKGTSADNFVVDILDGSDVLASSSSIMIPANGIHTEIFNLNFKEPGNRMLKARITQVSPEDCDITNNEEAFGIQVEKLPAPKVTSVEAADTGSGSGLNTGDTITIKFDISTNQSSVDSKYGIDSLIDFGAEKSLGSNYSGVWVDPQTLVIKVQDAAGGNIVIGDIITIKSGGNLTNADNTSGSCSDSYAIGGTFGDNKVVTVVFKDSNLEYAIRKALYMPEGDITNVDMAKLMRLVVSGKQINDLSGLEYAVNLNMLYLSSNQITNITPLGSLKELRELYIDGNGIADISALSNLKNLQILGISQNLVSDISPLRDLTDLQKLNASNNKISSIEALKYLVNMQELNLSYNAVSDISALGSLIKLSSLNLSYNSIININSMANLNGLTSVSIQKNQCPDLSPVKYLSSLQYLNCSENNIIDISYLGGLVNLSKLYIASNSIQDVSSLSSLTNIDTLDISGNPVIDISSVGNLVKLSSLKLDSTKVGIITPLQQLKNLQSLYMSGCEISDISALGGLSNIYNLVISGNRISDISSLGNLINIRWLNISGNQITSLAPLVTNSQNGGIGSGDYIDTTNNQLNLADGSKDMADIQILVNTGAMVKYIP